jgi:uncharacterized protein with beta-barrel porin domain
VKNFTRVHGETLPSARAATAPATNLLVAICCSLLSFTATAASNVVDQDFADYYYKPCTLGPAVLTNPPYNWTLEENFAYQDAICDPLTTGGYTSSSNISSSAGLGSISATSGTSESAARQQTDNVQDRLDELQDEEAPSKGWGLLLSVQTGETDHSETTNELGYDSDLNSVVVGLDYRFNDMLVTGIAVGYTTDDTDFNGDSGHLDTNSTSLIGYITYLVGAGGYVNGYLGYVSLDYDSKRKINIENAAGTGFVVKGDTSADYDGNQTLAGASVGYDWPLGDYTVGVFSNFDYSETDVDGYTEKGDTGFEMVFPDQTTRSGTISLGVNGSMTIDMGWAWLIPNASVQAVHETQNDSEKFNARLVLIPEDNPDKFTLETDDPDRDYGIVTLGAAIATNSGTQYFVNYEQVFNLDHYDIWSLSAGALIEF